MYNDLVDDLWNVAWGGRLKEVETIDSWEGHMIGGGSTRLATMEITPTSVWVVRLDIQDDNIKIVALSEYADHQSAIESIPHWRTAGRDPDY